MSSQDPPDRAGITLSFGVKATPDDEAPANGPELERWPVRIVVLSELGARAEYSTNLEPVSQTPVPVGRALDAWLERVAPALAIEVGDPFEASDRATLRVDLRFARLRDFRPERIVDQVASLRALGAATQILDQVSSGRVDASRARQELGRVLPRPSWAAVIADRLESDLRRRRPAPSPAAPATSAQQGKPAANSSVDALFDHVDLPGSTSQPTRTAPEPAAGERALAASIVSSVAKGARAPAAESAASASDSPLTAVRDLVHGAFRRLLSDILHHPEVRRLERAWRGLELLSRHADSRAGVQLEALVTGADDAADALARLVQQADGLDWVPVSLIVIDETIEPDARGVARLRTWADHAARLRAPLLAQASPALLGFDDLHALVRSTRRFSDSTESHAVALRTIAAQESARWVALCLNGPLGRPPHGADEPRTAVHFWEDPDDDAVCLFVNPAYAVASMVAKSASKLGHPYAVIDPRDGAGSVDNLPVRNRTEADVTVAFPLEVLASRDTVREAARAGLTLLTCPRNRDVALAPSVPTVHRGPDVLRGSDAPATGTLGEALLAGRLSHTLEQLAAAIPRGTDERAVREVCLVALNSLFPNPPPVGPEFDVKIAGGMLELTVRPRRYAGLELEELTLSAPLGG